MKIGKGTRLLLLWVALVVIDQIIKVLVKTNMELGEQIMLIGQWCRLCFVENEGMAFGMAFGGKAGKLILSLIRVVLSGALIWWIHSLLKKDKVPTGVLVGLTLITAGAIGNLVDCMFYGLVWDYAPFMFGKVVDMFYFPIIETNWPEWIPGIGGEHFIFFSPIFNFADAAISCGIVALLLFYGKYLNKNIHPSAEEIKG